MRPGANRPAAPPSERYSGDDDRSSDFSDQHGQTLQEQLIEQLELAKLSPIDMAIARVISDAITDDGYLKDSLEDVRSSLLPEIEAAPADVERVLGIVQSLEPAGVGARNLGECIALQLKQLDPETPARDVAIRVALEHLDLVASQQLALLRRQLRCSESDLEMALALVRSCHPRPGAAVNPTQAQYVIPDVFVRRTDHGWTVEINQATVPRVRVNQSYANLISRAPDHAMLRTQLQEARWLMRSLEIRNETLVKVARCIVQRQTELLRNRRRGDGAADPQGRGRGGRNARVDHLARHHRQVHAHAARRVRVPLFLFEPCRSGGRHRDVIHRHSRQDQETDFTGESRKSVERCQARGNSVARGHTGGQTHGCQIPRGHADRAVERTEASGCPRVLKWKEETCN